MVIDMIKSLRLQTSLKIQESTPRLNIITSLNPKTPTEIPAIG